MSQLKAPYLGLGELTDRPWAAVRALAAEFLGTALLVFIGCGSCIGGDNAVNGVATELGEQAQYVRIALAFGLTVATLAQSIGHVSGCHINPAITAGLITGAKVGLVKGLLYIVAQCLGALTGAGLLKAVVSGSMVLRGREGLGTTSISSSISAAQGFGVEFLITMVLVLVVFGAAADENNTVKGSAPLAIGLSITACHLFAIPLTGSSMNPARSLGSNVVAGNLTNLWVYLIGPTLGGITAGLFYQLVLAAPAPAKEDYTAVAVKDKEAA